MVLTALFSHQDLVQQLTGCKSPSFKSLDDSVLVKNLERTMPLHGSMERFHIERCDQAGQWHAGLSWLWGAASPVR